VPDLLREIIASMSPNPDTAIVKRSNPSSPRDRRMS
jgi:hypothetical protein